MKYFFVIFILFLCLLAFVFRHSLKQVSVLSKSTWNNNFRHMADLFPNKKFPAQLNPNLVIDSTKVKSFPNFVPQSNKQAINNSTEGYKTKYKDAYAWLQNSKTTSLLVWRDGYLIYEDYFNGADKNSLFTSWSVAKSFVSTLVGIAHEKGLIKSLDDPVTNYLPDWQNYSRITVKNLLEMRSGIKFNEDYSNTFSDITLSFPKAYWLGTSFGDQFKKLLPQDRPGVHFDYISSNSHILGLIVAAATKKPLEIFANEVLFSKIGHENEINWLIDKTNTALGFCGLNMTARDYLRFGILTLNKGRIINSAGVVESIYSEQWSEASTKPFAGGEPGSFIDIKLGYGFQWWIPQKNEMDQIPGDFSAIGYGGQFLYIDPKTKTIIVKTSADGRIERFEKEMEAFEFFREINTRLSNG